MTQLATTDHRPSTLPDPGDSIRDGLTGEEIVVKAEDQAVLRQFNELIWKHYGEVRRLGYVLGAYFNAMSEQRLYLAAGFRYEKEFYEKEYPEIGRATIMRLRKIARAFDLRVSLGDSQKPLALPEFCSLEHKKVEMLARLPAHQRDTLKKNGKLIITNYDRSGARIITIDELRTMSREEVQMLVSIALDDEREPRYRRGDGMREALPDLSPEAARILELIRRRSDMIIGLVSKFEKELTKEWTKVQRKRMADGLRGIADLLIHKAREIDPVKGRGARKK